MDVSKELARAEELTQSGQLAAAEAAAKSVLQISPREERAWHLLGVIYLMAGVNKAAEAAFREATSIAPTNGDYWSNLSIALHVQDQLAEAEACARRSKAGAFEAASSTNA